MISEKTVELNLTTELINWFSITTGRVHYALAPSQRMEGIFGFDTAILAYGTGILIQYKRAYVEGTIWTWHLNRTTRQDQHLRLQIIERQGVPVLYALPNFHTPSEIATFRRHLLVLTFWFPPSYINPPGGPIGHHEVNYDASNGRWWVSSDNISDIKPPLKIDEVKKIMRAKKHRGNLAKTIETFNKVLLKELPNTKGSINKIEDNEIFGVNIFANNQ